jgi:hypothetical protein
MVINNIRQNQKLIVLIQVVIFVAFCLRRVQNLIPFYVNNTDPAYEYLINGMNLIYGVTPGHADHPGSTVQWALSITHRFHFFWAGKSSNMIADFVESPENYAVTFSIFSVTAHAIIIYAIALKLYKVFKNVFYLLYPSIFTIIGFKYFDQLIGVKPENFLIMSSGLLVYSLLHLELKDDHINRLKPIIYGILLGIGVSTKVTFLLFFPIILLVRGIKKKIIFGIIFILTLLIINIKLYGTFSYKWFINIIFNGGRHGQDRSKSFSQVGSDLIEIIIFSYPSILISIILSLVLIIASKKNKSYSRNEIRIIKINYLFVFLGLLLVIKESLDRDFVLLIPFLALLLNLHISMLLKVVSQVNFLRKQRNLKFLSFVLFFANFLIITITLFILRSTLTISESKLNDSGITILEEFHKLNSEKGNIVITDYDTPTQFAALQFGNVMYGESVIKQEVDLKYPTSLHLVGSIALNGKGEPIGCQLFPQFISEGRKIFIFVKSLNETRERLNSSIHGYQFQFSDDSYEFEEAGLGWSVAEIVEAKCSNR